MINNEPDDEIFISQTEIISQTKLFELEYETIQKNKLADTLERLTDALNENYDLNRKVFELSRENYLLNIQIIELKNQLSRCLKNKN